MPDWSLRSFGSQRRLIHSTRLAPKHKQGLERATWRRGLGFRLMRQGLYSLLRTPRDRCLLVAISLKRASNKRIYLVVQYKIIGTKSAQYRRLSELDRLLRLMVHQ